MQLFYTKEVPHGAETDFLTTLPWKGRPMVHNFLTKGTIEEKIDEMLTRK